MGLALTDGNEFHAVAVQIDDQGLAGRAGKRRRPAAALLVVVIIFVTGWMIPGIRIEGGFGIRVETPRIPGLYRSRPGQIWLP